MPIAFVLVNAELGGEEEVFQEIKRVEGVEEAYTVYDIIAKIRAETMDKLKEIVTWHIRRINKVRSTVTMLVVQT